MLRNEATRLLNIKYPIIQAPMAGGVTTVELVSEVSDSGGLGMIGAGYLTQEDLRTQIKEIKQKTSNNFGVNLFVPNRFNYTEHQLQTAHSLLQPIMDGLNLSSTETVDLPDYNRSLDTFIAQIRVVIEEKVPVCSFTFGLPSADIIEGLKRHKILLIGTATTVREAVEIEERGLDMIVVQGSEAGGHRGNFISDFGESMIGLMSLVPQVVDQVHLPVIAAGGIMDGRGLMAAVCLGAKGVQMGTAFLTCVESGAHPLHKKAILQTNEEETVVTRAFSGKWARGIQNKFIEEIGPHERDLPEFPIQNALTKPIRKASSSQQNPNYMSLWSGQSPSLAKDQTAASLIKEIMAEARQINKNLFT